MNLPVALMAFGSHEPLATSGQTLPKFKRPPKVVQDELPSIKPARKEVAQLLAGHTEHEKKAQAVLARRQELARTRYA